MKTFTRPVTALAFAAIGIYAAGADDKPGAAVIGMLLMVVGVVLGVRAVRTRLPVWATRATIAAGVVVAALAAYLIHAEVVAAALFPEAQEVTSVVTSGPPPRYLAAVDLARALARAAVVDQNLPGVSVAVGVDLPAGALAKEGGTLVWAEGFGWRDIGTRTPVTPDTRFNIGTAASAITAAVAALGLSNTGADPATEWSPEYIGEPEEDFPGFTLFRHVLWQPLGLMPAEYPLRGDRATFYVPRSGNDPARGRRLMRMRDLACCANGMAFYSTPSDLVRFGLASTVGSIDGELAGGTVMSLMTTSNGAVVVAVTSNIAYAKTSLLARQVADAFAERAR